VSAAADPYTRCPDCGFIAPPESMDYTLTPGDGIDWDRAVRVTCLVCHGSHHIGGGDVLQAAAETTCHRCGAPVAYRPERPGSSVSAAGCSCSGRTWTPGGGDELAVTEGLAGLALRRPTSQPESEPPSGAGTDPPARGPVIPSGRRGLAMPRARPSARGS
jgi:hypothetical protein